MKKKMRRTHVWLFVEDYEKLRKLAFKERKTMSVLIREGLVAVVENYKK